MFKKEVLIEGMECNNCKARVEKVLRSIDGVEEVEVSLENKKAIIKTSKQIENSKIKETIEDIGFSVNQIQ